MMLLKLNETGALAIVDNNEPDALDFSAWQEGAVFSGNGPKVLRISHDINLAQVDANFSGIQVIELTFPIYRDGRAFTQARQLRRLGFEGTLRATGDVLRDQVLYMSRTGFTEFECPEGQSLKGFQDALSEFSAYYQHAKGGALPVWELRSKGKTEGAV